MTPIAEFTCSVCYRGIVKPWPFLGHHTGVVSVAGPRVLCLRCSFSRDVHTDLWPDCRYVDHRPWEHSAAEGSAEVIRAWLNHALLAPEPISTLPPGPS